MKYTILAIALLAATPAAAQSISQRMLDLQIQQRRQYQQQQQMQQQQDQLQRQMDRQQDQMQRQMDNTPRPQMNRWGFY